MSTVRLTLKLHRFEILAVVAGAVVVAGAALAVWSMMAPIATPARCIEDRFLDPVPAECLTTERFLELNEAYAGKVMAAMAVLPFIAGALLGVSLVAREIEQRTASIAWSLSASRRRWLLARFGLLAAILGVVLALPAVTAGVLEGVRMPWIDPGSSFHDYALRGPVVVARGLAAFAIAVLAGALLGRVLPGLIVAAVGCLVAFNLLAVAMPFGQPIEKLPAQDYGMPDRYDLMTWNGPVEIGGDGTTGTEAFWGVPGERLREVEAREVGVLGAGVLVLAGLAVAVVDRRRPY